MLIALVGVGLGWAGALCAGEPRGNERPAAKYTRAALIPFEGEIGGRLEYSFFRRLHAAEQAGVDLVIIGIDSPGGRVDSTLRIAARLRDLKIHTVAYVPEMALSGAAIVSLGCDDIIMGPHAKLGDAGEIYLAEGWMYREVPQKFRTHLVAEVRTLAAAKGRPPALAEAMVDKDKVVYRVRSRKTDQVTFLSDNEIEADPEPDQWEKLNPVQESLGDNFLEVNGRRAVEVDLAQGNVDNLAELKDRYGLTEPLLVYEYTSVDTAVYLLNSPWITGLLLVVGLVALYVEFSAPGIGVGGLIAGLCFALFFWSRFLGGTAGVLEILLFVSGVAFLIVELFILPGFGVAGFSGILLVLSSLILASQDFVIPRTPEQWSQLTGMLLVILVAGLIVAFAAYQISRRFGSLPLLNRLVLVPPEPDGGGTEVVLRGDGKSAVAVGSRGVAVSTLRPAGKAQFDSQYVDVVTDGEFIPKGSPVEILEIRGNRVVVGPC